MLFYIPGSSMENEVFLTLKKRRIFFTRSNFARDLQYHTFWIGLYANVSDFLRNEETEIRRQAEWKWLDGTPYDYANGLGWSDNQPWYDEYLGTLERGKWGAEPPGLRIPPEHPYVCETSKSYLLLYNILFI